LSISIIRGRGLKSGRAPRIPVPPPRIIEIDIAVATADPWITQQGGKQQMGDETAMAAGRRRISSGSEFEKTYSYSRAVVVGPHIMLSGTTGYDYAASTLAPGAQEQTRQLFRNAAAAFDKAGAGLADVVRVRMYIADAADYEAVMGVFAATFRDIDPACTTVQAGLFDPEILVEMDMDAIVDVRA
jgi:enamine deaminase RidA (YjgF/YER057c/UK114 family)